MTNLKLDEIKNDIKRTSLVLKALNCLKLKNDDNNEPYALNVYLLKLIRDYELINGQYEELLELKEKEIMSGKKV